MGGSLTDREVPSRVRVISEKKKKGGGKIYISLPICKKNSISGKRKGIAFAPLPGEGGKTKRKERLSSEKREQGRKKGELLCYRPWRLISLRGERRGMIVRSSFRGRVGKGRDILSEKRREGKGPSPGSTSASGERKEEAPNPLSERERGRPCCRLRKGEGKVETFPQFRWKRWKRKQP